MVKGGLRKILQIADILRYNDKSQSVCAI
jgi:hypothetical protein